MNFLVLTCDQCGYDGDDWLSDGVYREPISNGYLCPKCNHHVFKGQPYTPVDVSTEPPESRAEAHGDLPSVGDWVRVILNNGPRRDGYYEVREQVLAATKRALRVRQKMRVWGGIGWDDTAHKWKVRGECVVFECTLVYPWHSINYIEVVEAADW